MIVLGTWIKGLDALRWLLLAGMHQPMIQRHMRAPERGTRTGRGSKRMIAMIVPHAHHWLLWADMHQQHQDTQERLRLSIPYERSLGTIKDLPTNLMPAAAQADTVKDPTYFRRRSQRNFRPHILMTKLNSDIAPGSRRQHHPIQL